MCLFIYSFADVFVYLLVFDSLCCFIINRLVRDRITFNVNKINNPLNEKFTEGCRKNLACFSLNPGINTERMATMINY